MRQQYFIVLLLLIGGFLASTTGVSAAFGDTTTYIGQAYSGDGGDKLSAFFDFPEDIAVQGSGVFYVADTANHVIRKIDTDGKVSTLAGTGSYGFTNGAANVAEFASPKGVTVDSNGNVYVADTENDAIRKIDSYGVVSTLVGSGLNGPEGVALYGGYVYIADTGNNALKRVAAIGGNLETVTSNLNAPKKMAIDAAGTHVYVADSGSYKVKRVTRATGEISDIAGSGVAGYAEGIGSAAVFQNVWGVALVENTLYVSDGDGFTDRLRKIDLITNTTSLVSVDSTMVGINYPAGLLVFNGSVYLANSGLGTIRQFPISDPNSNSDFAGSDRFGNRDGAASQALVGRPWDLVLSPDRAWLYVAENNKVRKIQYSTGDVSLLAGNSVDNYIEGVGGAARFSNIPAIAISPDGGTVYAADRWNNRIRKITVANQSTSLVAGGGLINTNGTQDNGYVDGAGEAARFRNPAGLAISPDGGTLYVSDTGNNRIRQIDVATGQTSLVAGSGAAGLTDGAGGNASFNKPYGLALNAAGTELFVADTNNHVIRRITLSSHAVVTIAGTGSAGYRDAIGRESVFSYPEYVKVDSAGNVYVSEVGSQRIRLIEANTLVTKLIAGSGDRGFKNGTRTVSEFNAPKGLMVDKQNSTVLVADSNSDVIRSISIAGTAPYTEAAPTLTQIIPGKISLSWDNGSGLRVKAIGTNFRHGASTTIGLLTAKKTYVNSATELVIDLPVSQMEAGWYDIQVKNSDGQAMTLSRALSVMNSQGQVPEVDHLIDETGVFYAYASGLNGGYYVGSGNVTGDGKEEVVVGTGMGLGPQVRVLTSTGQVKGQFFAYASHLRSGVRVTTCDLNGDGVEEIITAPGPGGRPHIRIFNAAGQPKFNAGFFALDGKFKGGANVACGDVNGDGQPEIIVAASRGGGPHVTIHRSNGSLLGSFMAYAANFRGGITVALGDLDGDGALEIITGPEKGGPHIQVFTGRGRRMHPGTFAFNPSFGGGITVAAGDIDGDGIDEILATPGPSSQAEVKIYRNFGKTLASSFYVFPRSFTGAARISAGDVTGDGVAEIIAIPNSNGSPQVRIYDANGSSVE